MKTRIKFLYTVSAVMWLFFFTSCAEFQQNVHLEKFEGQKGYRYQDPAQTKNQDRLFIALAFSGGGTRAAALSYGVLKELSKIPIPNQAGQMILGEVDIISSVSGGSFTAAYYGLFGDRIFEDFESKFLYRNIQGELLTEVLKPWNWARLASPYFSRIDIAAELYDETIFDQSTFDSLGGAEHHPYIALNATNLATGAQFTFTQKQFDIIGSDLDSYPVARAVAASSAFPFLLAPISLVNHEAPEGYDLPVDMKLALKSKSANTRRYLWAKNRTGYHLEKEKHPYLHLMDGGLADNVGLRYFLTEYARTSGILSRRKGSIDHLVVIVVNAKTQPPEELELKKSPPGLKDVAFKTATVSMDNYTFESVEVTKSTLIRSEQARINIEKCRELLEEYCCAGDKLQPLGQQYKTHLIEINLLNIKDQELQQELLSLPTSFALETDQVNKLINAGGGLLRDSKEFNTLLQELSGVN